ncbi:MAG: NmrA family NAD(P)-binding protein [Ferruginibacter sp.]|nr:NmrA family NAD(P)-binding protein [Ferruginibacter sp.]
MEHVPQDEQKQTENPTQDQVVILAGATGNLGHRVAVHLLAAGSAVKALVRKGSNSAALETLGQQGVQFVEVDFANPDELKAACKGGSCLVSALSGLSDVIIDVQTNLLDAAVSAGVPRFIPSDYCIDYTKLQEGSNRNLDLRRQFNKRLNQAPIAATSILNGMFTDLLTGQAPIIIQGIKRVVYWGSAEQLLDFTTTENTAEFTARAAMDATTPRYLRIAGEVTNIKGLQKSASAASGKTFQLLRAGGLGGLQRMINITRFLLPKKKEVFPPWQGMQYMHNMFTGRPKLTPLDNDRYPGIHWTSVEEVLQNAKK